MNFAAAAVAAAIPKLMNKNLNPKTVNDEFALKLNRYFDQEIETLKSQGFALMLQMIMMSGVRDFDGDHISLVTIAWK